MSPIPTSGKFLSLIPTANYQRVIGSLKGGEGYFKRPTGIAVDSAAERIYVTDTLRNKIYMLDMQGNILQQIGQKALATRVQFSHRVAPERQRLDRGGCHEFPRAGTRSFRRLQVRHRTNRRQHGRDVPSQRDRRWIPKATSIVVDGLWGIVQVFNRQGRLAVLLWTAWHRPRDNFNCRLGCLLIMTTGFLWWIP